MNVAANKFSEYVKPLPEKVVLRSGVTFNPAEDEWKFLDGVRMIYMDFSSLPEQVKPLIINLKKTLINILELQSPAYAINMFYCFARLAKIIAIKPDQIQKINKIHIINAISEFKLKKDLGLESQLSALINRWVNLELDGIEADAVNLINSIRKKGNKKGEAVINLDPIKGPFSDLEFEQLMSSINEAYAKNKIAEDLFLLSWLVALTGQRVSQYCSLKVKDLKRISEDGNLRYEINIPTAKQRNEVTRDSFLLRPLPIQIGEALWIYSRKIIEIYPEMGMDAPLFPTKSNANIEYQRNKLFENHHDSVVLSAYFNKELKNISPISHRTENPIHISVGRFRDTIGTRAAQEGFGELVIAEILGHSDTQNVKSYVAVIPEIAARLDKQLAKDLAPIANAFNGKIISNKLDATRGLDAASQIIDYANSGKGVGNCGTTYDCRFNAPIACYVCHNFEAWLDAPHENLLDHLINERERLLKKSGPRIASVNDRVIIAIQSVVDACNLIKRNNNSMKALENG